MTDRDPRFADLGAPAFDASAKARVRARLFAAAPQRRFFTLPIAAALTALLGGIAIAAPIMLRESVEAPPVVVVVETPQPTPVPEEKTCELNPEVVEHAPPAPTKPKPRLTEARLLGEALELIKAGRAEDALVKLNAYDRAFPRGMMRAEAAIARVRAWLVLGREDAALAVLEESEIDLERTPRGLELRLLRGELLAGAGRCAEASAEFQRVLARDPPPAWRQRAERACPEDQGAP